MIFTSTFITLVVCRRSEYMALHYIEDSRHCGGFVPRPREEGKKQPGTNCMCMCQLPQKTWGSEYDRIFSVLTASTHP